MQDCSRLRHERWTADDSGQPEAMGAGVKANCMSYVSTHSRSRT
jgi:hypothetical protein